MVMKGGQSLATWQEAGRSEGQVSNLDVPWVSDKAPQAQCWVKQVSDRNYRQVVGNLTDSNGILYLKYEV